MAKLIHADFYKTFHRVYFYILAAGLAALCFLMNYAKRGGMLGNMSSSVQFAVMLLEYPVIILSMVTQIVFSEEFQFHTLKNTASYGTNRTLLFTAKLITSILLCMILAAVVLAAYFGSMFIFLKHDAEFTSSLLNNFFMRLGVSCAVYAACITMSAFFTVLFRRNGLAIFFYYGVFYLMQYFLVLLHLEKFESYLLEAQFATIRKLSVTSFQKPLMVSAVTTLVFFIAGAVAFRRKDLC